MISRQAAIDAVEEIKKWNAVDGEGYHVGLGLRYTDVINTLTELPSAQPEYNMNEWCTDCKEYDQERHCCPRFNRVIRETVDEVKNNQWIPCSERLPDTDDHVLVTTINKRGDRRVVRAYYYRSDDYPGGGAWAAGMNNNVIAWMPLPEPYGGEA